MVVLKMGVRAKLAGTSQTTVKLLEFALCGMRSHWNSLTRGRADPHKGHCCAENRLSGDVEPRSPVKRLLCSGIRAAEEPGLDASPSSVGIVLQGVQRYLPCRKFAQSLSTLREGSVIELGEDTVGGDQAVPLSSHSALLTRMKGHPF